MPHIIKRELEEIHFLPVIGNEAAQREKVEMLREGINERDKWNEYKLTSAALSGSDEYVLALLAAGANPLLRDTFGFTARDYAKQNGRTDIAQHLAIAERLWKQKSMRPPAPAPASSQEVKSHI